MLLLDGVFSLVSSPRRTSEIALKLIKVADGRGFEPTVVQGYSSGQRRTFPDMKLRVAS